jgi:hypothetical protein
MLTSDEARQLAVKIDIKDETPSRTFMDCIPIHPKDGIEYHLFHMRKYWNRSSFLKCCNEVRKALGNDYRTFTNYQLKTSLVYYADYVYSSLVSIQNHKRVA